MKCTNCGAEIAEGSVFCEQCGTKFDGSEAPLENVATTPEYVAPTETLGLGWAKFLSHFALWMGGIVDIYNGFISITGAKYGGQADAVYSMFPGAKGADFSCGLIFIALAVLNVCTAISIIKRKKTSLKLVIMVYAGAIIATVLNAGLLTAATGINCFEPSIVSNIIVNSVMLVINYCYFKKRDSIFTK